VGVGYNPVYRVTIDPTTDRVEIMSFDLENVDAPDLGQYSSINEAPKWVQDRIAVLMLVDPTPPTKEVDGVGHRIDANTYWVALTTDE